MKPRPLLLWNLSPSAPVGLYLVESPIGFRRGDIVAVFAPKRFRELAAARSYVPASVPLVKRVAGVERDQVCGSGRWLRINNRNVARRLKADIRGRRLPWWNGCRRLKPGELFVLNGKARSFDSRYFGPAKANSVVGKLVLLWSG
jgi:conjugative transfer signal peptidase TraF